MTLLNHEHLTARLEHPLLSERLVVMPLLDKQKQVGPASVDVRLGTRFSLLERTEGPGIDPATDAPSVVSDAQRPVTVAFGDAIWLHPGQFLLGSTLEYLRFPSDLGAYVMGRSSWGRIGLIVATAIMIQPGFAGNLTLELVNHGESPIALYAGSRIAQLAVHSMSGATRNVYDGKYNGPTGPEPSRLDKERNDIDKLRAIQARLSGG